MGVFGLGRKASKPAKKAVSKKSDTSSKSKEAKALLAKMQAKKDAGDCAFC